MNGLKFDTSVAKPRILAPLVKFPARETTLANSAAAIDS